MSDKKESESPTVVVPALLFGPAGNTDGSSSRDLLDLGSLFDEDFYPEEMDYSLFLKDLGFDGNLSTNQSLNTYADIDEPTIGNVPDDAFVNAVNMGSNRRSALAGNSNSNSNSGKGEAFSQQLDDLRSAQAQQQAQLLQDQQRQQQILRRELQNGNIKTMGRPGQRRVVPIQPNVTKYGVVTVPPAMPMHQPVLDQFGIPLDEDDDDEPISTLDANGEELDGRKRRKKSRGIAQVDPLTLTEQQKLERRERNREHAKRSRIRKKVLLDLLQEQLAVLRGENSLLRRVVQERIPEKASSILADCTTEESLLLFSDDEGDSPSGDGDGDGVKKSSRLKRSLSFQHKYDGADGRIGMGAGGEMKQGARILVEPDFRLIQALVGSQQNFVLSDPSLPDNPIVYCSDGFCKITGYKRHEIIGRNCRFLQGPGTDSAAVDVIRQGVAEGKDISVCLLNYKADQTPFWNQFFVAALRDSDGAVVNYVGVQCEVNIPQISQIKDRVKKLPIDK